MRFVASLWRLVFLASMFAAILQAPQAQAAVIAEFILGTVSGPSTIDTYGLFGPAGSNLAGQKVRIFLQYNPSQRQFVFSYCGPGCEGHYTERDKPDNPGAALLVVSVAGERLAYLPFHQAFVIVESDTNSFTLGVDATPSISASIHLTMTQPEVFGARLSPRDPPINPPSVDPPSTLQFGTASGTEQLTFSIDAAAR